MNTPRAWTTFLGRAEEGIAAGPPKAAEGAPPPATVLEVMLTGQYEALVAQARPAEPPKMITPEEREAELRAKGEWKEEKPAAAAAPTEPEPEPGPEPGMPTEPTLSERWANERCAWRPRPKSSFNRNPRPGRCITEYDVFTGEVIGDGYDPRY